jgi:3-dehydroquinate synthase
MDRQLRVNLGKNSYDIIIKKGIINNISEMIKSHYTGRKIFILTDENVFIHYGKAVKENLYKAGFVIDILALPAGEITKSFEILPKIYEHMLKFRLNRKELLITLGGGVIGDLGGFAASTYLRGISYVQIPTSLLAQVDSSIGGKVAVNLSFGKNLVGSFYQPKAVFIDPNVLSTLPQKYFEDGMAEVIKYGCIQDVQFFNVLLAYKSQKELMRHIDEVIYTCCNIKKSVVEHDERDYGERMKLNFGHTYAHAIEKYYDYKVYSHGQAVAIGMVSITKISEDMGITEKGTLEKLTKLLQQYGLPTHIEVNDTEKVLSSIALDKKNLDDVLYIILLKELGESFIYKASPSFFASEQTERHM